MAYIIIGTYTTTQMPDIDGYKRALQPVGASRRALDGTKVIHRAHRGKWTYSLKWSGIPSADAASIQAALVEADDVAFTDVAGTHMHCELLSANFEPMGLGAEYMVTVELEEV